LPNVKFGKFGSRAALEQDGFRVNRFGFPLWDKADSTCWLEERGRHGWQSRTLSIFASGWLRQLRKAGCRGVKRRRILPWGSARSSIGCGICGNGQRGAGSDGWAQAEVIRDEHEAWLRERIREPDFPLRGLVAELAARGLKSTIARYGTSFTPRS
jgi:hypothetical protein